MDKKNHIKEEESLINLSVPAAAQTLGISRRKMDELIYNRKIDHVRIGSRVLIPLAALKKFNSQNLVKAVDFTGQLLAQ